ncbi:MAG: epoxyqueuosine reductase QueH [bacterium]|nr:epoxyqueuosine reductase QueH [Clostridium sp.]MCM1537072.1 epoxyqueuosine reductase QueH [bacterium]
MNFQRELDRLLQTIPAGERSLLLHSCCAPCSSYCMEYLREYFRITVFFFNPNITEQAEYEKRAAEEKRLIAAYNEQVERGCFTGMHSTKQAQKIEILEGRYCPQDFFQMAEGYEQCREGGERCLRCYELRLRETAETAARGGYDFFTTTLSISPLKSAAALNEIGGKLAEEYGVPYLFSDFKKKDGYKRSVELSARFGLYRQDYCGCVYSKAERERQKRDGMEMPFCRFRKEHK